MPNKKLVLVSVALVIGVSGASAYMLVAQGNNYGGVEWETDYDAALQQAEAADKPMLIYFAGENCKYCEQFQRRMGKADVEDELHNYVRVKLMWGENPDVVGQYLSPDDGTPTVVVATPDGERVSKYVPGGVDSLPEKFERDYRAATNATA